MKQNLLTLFILIATSTFLFSQTSLEQAIRSISDQDSTTTYIDNQRKRIKQEIKQGNPSEAVAIFNLMNLSINPKKHLGFFYDEKQLLAFIDTNFTLFFETTANFNQQSKADLPNADSLAIVCTKYILSNKKLYKVFGDSTFTDEQNKVLRIFMGVIGIYDHADENRRLVKQFNKRYPNSKYKDYIKQVTSDFNTSYNEYYAGIGTLNLMGNLSETVTANSLFYFDYGWSYNDYFLDFYISGAFNSSLNVSYTTYYDDEVFVLSENRPLFTMFLGGKFGMSVINTKWIRITPYGSIGISSNDYKDIIIDDSSLNLDVGFTLGAGVNADISLINWTQKNQLIAHEIGLRLNADYLHNFTNQRLYTGDAISLKAGIFYRFTEGGWY